MPRATLGSRRRHPRPTARPSARLPGRALRRGRDRDHRGRRGARRRSSVVRERTVTLERPRAGGGQARSPSAARSPSGRRRSASRSTTARRTSRPRGSAAAVPRRPPAHAPARIPRPLRRALAAERIARSTEPRDLAGARASVGHRLSLAARLVPRTPARSAPADPARGASSPGRARGARGAPPDGCPRRVLDRPARDVASPRVRRSRQRSTTSSRLDALARRTRAERPRPRAPALRAALRAPRRRLDLRDRHASRPCWPSRRCTASPAPAASTPAVAAAGPDGHPAAAVGTGRGSRSDKSRQVLFEIRDGEVERSSTSRRAQPGTRRSARGASTARSRASTGCSGTRSTSCAASPSTAIRRCRPIPPRTAACACRCGSRPSILRGHDYGATIVVYARAALAQLRRSPRSAGSPGRPGQHGGDRPLAWVDLTPRTLAQPPAAAAARVRGAAASSRLVAPQATLPPIDFARARAVLSQRPALEQRLRARGRLGHRGTAPDRRLRPRADAVAAAPGGGYADVSVPPDHDRAEQEAVDPRPKGRP